MGAGGGEGELYTAPREFWFCCCCSLVCEKKNSLRDTPKFAYSNDLKRYSILYAAVFHFNPFYKKWQVRKIKFGETACEPVADN